MQDGQRHCVPCEKGGKPYNPAVVALKMTDHPGWSLAADGISIRKDFKFEDFKDAMGFLNEVADIAEFEGHHPDMRVHDWNRAEICLWTHACKGLTENDFILAALIDRAIEDRNS